AQGRDSALPHDRGDDQEILQVGKCLILDIFPQVAHNGYFHDLTRTWCIGHAPADIQAVYDDVMTIFQHVMAALKPGEQSRSYQEMVCDYFEERNYPTNRSAPGL